MLQANNLVVFGINLPLGFRFSPTDEELIEMIVKEPSPYIFNVNIYQYSPSVLTDIYPSLGDDEWYFYTTRDKKYANGSRPNRAAGDGYWKATVADRRLYGGNNECSGYKKTLVFYQGKAPNGKKTNWIMHEYTVDQNPKHPRGSSDDMRLDDHVLCRIYERKKIAVIEEATDNMHAGHKRVRTGQEMDDDEELNAFIDELNTTLESSG